MSTISTLRSAASSDDGLIAALGDSLTADQIARATSAAARSGTRLERTLVELGLMTEEALASILADWLDMPSVTTADVDSGFEPPTSLTPDYLTRAQLVPIARQDGVLLVATANPRDIDGLRSLAFHLGEDIRPAVATSATVAEAIRRLTAQPETAPTEAADSDVERLQALANDGPVIKLVTELLTQAVDLGASDMHLEALEASAIVRLRIDGALEPLRHLSEADRRAATSRLKVMADLNIAEHRRPQDGRARITVRGRNIDLRLSTLPTQFGESVVIRILDQSRLVLDWAALGFSPERIEQLEAMIHQPNGIFLVSGPTGSGKTTTLYTALSRINTTERKIITIEDPIEYNLPGINQVQVRPEIDLTFATALRAILRQDPDVVMIGEIRDAETAENAVRAALMGRLVLSTVHTNTAEGAIARLKDLGVPQYLIDETLRGVLAQRLQRVPCEACGGPGCGVCRETGVEGRKVDANLYIA